MAKIITSEVAASYLEPHGLKIGGWNELADSQGKVKSIRSAHCGHMTALESMNFSQHVAGWLAKGDWKILQIDNSSSFTADASLLLSSLLLGPGQQVDLVKNRTFLFEVCASKVRDLQVEVAISHLINLLLVWEAHGYMVSAGAATGERLGLQDGFVYFYGSNARLEEATALLTEFEANPRRTAKWISALNEER